MLTLAQLQRLSQLDFTDIDETQLVDIRDIHIDPTLPAQERLSYFIEEVQNPYMFRVGKVPVRVAFTPTGKPLDIVLKNHVLNAFKGIITCPSML